MSVLTFIPRYKISNARHHLLHLFGLHLSKISMVCIVTNISPDLNLSPYNLTVDFRLFQTIIQFAYTAFALPRTNVLYV